MYAIMKVVAGHIHGAVPESLVLEVVVAGVVVAGGVVVVAAVVGLPGVV